MTYQPKHRLCVKPKHHQYVMQGGWFYRGVEVRVPTCTSCLEANVSRIEVVL